MRVLLDTCTFVWLCSEPKRLPPKVRTLLSRSAADLWLSDVSALEISLKWMSGKIELPSPPRSWVEQQIAAWQLRLAPISRPVIYRAAELPRIHGDPFDRLLAATALEHSATIVTPDEWLRRYPVACAWD
jgi:PIN domain nuclease of toxin-antitoxin system